MTMALLATGSVAEAGAESRTLTHETTKGRSCSVRVHATSAAATTYGIASERCNTKRGVRYVSGGSFLLRRDGRVVPGSQISEHGHLPFRLEGTYSGSEEAWFHRGDFTVVLRSPQTRRPERWKRRSVPRDCVISTTHHSRDTLACALQVRVAAG